MAASKRGSIQDFRVVKRLGKGAFAQVYKVVRKADGQVYALKKVNIARMQHREIADALNEIRLLASVDHRNVVGYLDAFIIDTSLELCIVQEFANGGDLAERIENHSKRGGSFDEHQIWAYLIQLLEGMAYLHSCKIIHRDLKPANVFMMVDGTLKIGDMNVSKLAKHQIAQTQIGTPYYIAPEVYRNRPYDNKTDVWAIGCIAYELATLKPPFRGRDIKELSRRVQSGYYGRMPSRYSRDLHDIVAKMLQVDPRRRPSASDLLKSDAIQSRKAQLSQWMNETLRLQREIDLGSGGGGDLLGTIAAPRRMDRRGAAQISDALPAPKYDKKDTPAKHGGGSGGGSGSGGAIVAGRTEVGPGAQMLGCMALDAMLAVAQVPMEMLAVVQVPMALAAMLAVVQVPMEMLAVVQVPMALAAMLAAVQAPMEMLAAAQVPMALAAVEALGVASLPCGSTTSARETAARCREPEVQVPGARQCATSSTPTVGGGARARGAEPRRVAASDRRGPEWSTTR